MGGLQDVLLLPDKKRTDFSWHEIEVSIRIAFHAIKNITSDILSEIILQNKSRQTENSVGDFTYPIIYKPVNPEKFTLENSKILHNFK